VQLCKKIRVVIFKIKGRKNEKPKLIARFTKKKDENKNRKLRQKSPKCVKNESMKSQLLSTAN
jgi:hypothetical protein